MDPPPAPVRPELLDNGVHEDKKSGKGHAKRSPEDGKLIVLLSDLSKNGRYVLKIYLHSKDEKVLTDKEVAAAINTITEKKGMRVAFFAKSAD